MFRQTLGGELDENVFPYADDGYTDIKCLRRSHQRGNEKECIGKMFNHLETVNAVLKRFKVLIVPFRHLISKYQICFQAFANITQAMFLYKKSTFSVMNIKKLFEKDELHFLSLQTGKN